MIDSSLGPTCPEDGLGPVEVLQRRVIGKKAHWRRRLSSAISNYALVGLRRDSGLAFSRWESGLGKF